LLHNAICENVHLVVRKLRNSPKLADYASTGALQFAGGIYDLRTGRVSLLDRLAR
jgi:carbonic anhydrase